MGKLLCVFGLFWAILAGAEEYGKEIMLERVAGIDEGAMAVALDDHTLWVAGSRGSLFAVDVSVPDAPRLIGKSRFLNRCRQLAICNGIGAIVGRDAGMVLVDLHDPAKPKFLGRYQSIELATGIELAGKYAYIANRVYGVESVDVSNPAHPRFLGNLLTPEAQTVKFAGGLLFAGDWGAGRVTIADATNPAILKPLGQIQLDGYGDGLDVCGNLLYASTGHHSKSGSEKSRWGNGHALEIWNIQDPVKPRRLARFCFPRFFRRGHDFWTVRVSGDYAFCVDTHNGFYVLKVSDPEKPVCVGHAQLEKLLVPQSYDENGNEVKNMLLSDAASGLAVGDGVVYITGETTGLYLAKLPEIAVRPKVDPIPDLVAVPAPPTELKGYASYHTAGMIRDAEVVGDVAFLATSEEGIASVRLTDRGIEPLHKYPGKFVFDVKARDGFLYVAEDRDGLGGYAIRDNGILEPVGHISSKGYACQRVWAPEGSTLVAVTNRSGSVRFWDASDPAQLRETLAFRGISLAYSDLMTHQVVGGKYLFFNWHSGGYAWYDVSGKDPVQANQNKRNFNGHLNGAVSLGDQCMVIAGGGYYLLEANQPGNASEWNLIKVQGKSIGGIPTVDKDTAVIAQRRTGEITVLNITDPHHPVWNRQRSLTVPGHPGAVGFFKGRMVIPAGYAGLYLELPKGAN